MTKIRDPKAFIRRETRIKPVPHAPEIRLHVADEAMDLWSRTEEELGELGLDPPFWAFAWAGGQALARYILDHPDLVRAKSIMDLASGSGIVGIAAMMAGATRCQALDIDPFATAAGELNAEANNVAISFETRDVTSEAPLPADVLFCGDVFYDKPMSEHMLAYLDRCMGSGITIYVGDPGRSYLPKERLELLATYEVPVIGALEDAEIKKSSVFRLLAAGTSG